MRASILPVAAIGVVDVKVVVFATVSREAAGAHTLQKVVRDTLRRASIAEGILPSRTGERFQLQDRNRRVNAAAGGIGFILAPTS